MPEGSEVDTSIYKTLGGGGGLEGPMALLKGASELRGMGLQQQGAMLSNEQLGREIQARQATGRILQQSTNPDGSINFSKAMTLSAQDPEAAWMAPDFMEKAMKIQGVSMDNLLKNLTNATKRNEIYGNAAASVLAKGTDVQRGKDLAPAISQAYASLVESGVHDQETLDGLLSFLGAAPEGGQALYDYVHRASQMAAGATDSLNRLQSTLHTVDTGPSIDLFHFNPNQPEKGARMLGSVAKSLTPGEAAAPQPVAGPEGQTQYVPLGEYYAQPESQHRSPVANIGPYGAGRLGEAVDYEKTLNSDVNVANSSVQQLQQLQLLAAKAHPGWAATERQEMGRVLKALGVNEGIVDKVANGELASSQEIMKYALPAAMGVLHNSLGSGRPNQLMESAFAKTQPNLETDPKAFQHVLEFNRKLLRLKQMEQQGFKKWRDAGRNPADFPSAWADELVSRGLIVK